VLPASDGVVINTVFFAPGARTFWHHHEHGQILHVLAGSGLVRSDGGPVQPLRPGDVVWVPPGERHWHGAGPGSYLVHLAISLGTTVWAEEVAGAQGAGPRPM
jgi:quercetin dioxygenase-like cupin family protein